MIMEIPNIEVKNVSWHRNGVCGVGFYSVAFDYQDGEKARSMIANVFNEAGYCAVIDVNEPLTCWRGDYFEDLLRPILKTHQGS
jgi:hypothetical protein